ncbi:MAG: hypothetical protein ACLFV3_06545 [Phycisphaeraceae bacterium]
MAPYEVMRSQALKRRPSAPAREPAASEPTETGEGIWAGARAPLVLRVPRGMAVLLGLGLLGLIVLAFVVGYEQGQSAAEQATADAGSQSASPRLARAPAVPAGAAGLDASPAEGSQTPGSAGERAPAWKESESYLCVATHPHEVAERLAEYMRGAGVEVGVIPHDNDRSKVVCRRGFGDTSSSEAKRFRARIVNEIGPDWDENHRGPTDLSDAYWIPYQARWDWP